MRTTTSVTMPSMPFAADERRPSDRSRARRLRRRARRCRRRCRRRARPRAPTTWFTVKPYLRQCAPPEFSATLPPIVHTLCELTDRARSNSRAARDACEMSRLMTPGCTRMRAVRQVDVEDAVHPRGADDDAAVDRQRAAGEPGARRRAARSASRARAPAHAGRDFFGRRGQHHDARPDAVAEQPVALVGAQLARRADRVARADDGGEAVVKRIGG